MPRTRKLLRTMAGGEAAFNLAFSNDGKRLATASGDFAFVWDVGYRPATSESHPCRFLRNTYAAASGSSMPPSARMANSWLMRRAATNSRMFGMSTPAARFLSSNMARSVAAVAFNADGTKLGTGSYDGTARVWELPSGNELERVSHAGGAEVVVFSPTGSRFAAGGMDGSVSVSETRRADRPAFFDLPSDVRSVAFSPDGQRVAIGTVSAHSSPLVRIADIGGNVLRDIEFHGAPVIDKLYFLNPNEVIAQWSNKLFLIAVDQASGDSLAGYSRREADRPIRQDIRHPGRTALPSYTRCRASSRPRLWPAPHPLWYAPQPKANWWPSKRVDRLNGVLYRYLECRG